MSNYIQSTNFATKDSLPSGDPLKIVKGTEINTEFNNIAVAVATKADLVSPAFTGVPQAPTASPGTNSVQIATTAYTDAAITAVAAVVKAALFPVGSIYTNAVDATNPATLLGFGTWTAFGAGRVPVGFNASDPLFDAAEETGGSKDATVVSHSHTLSADGSHQHAVFANADTGFTDLLSTNTANYKQQGGNVGVEYVIRGSATSATLGLTSNAGSHTHPVSTTGSSGTNANLQPYITVYMWKRTA